MTLPLNPDLPEVQVRSLCSKDRRIFQNIKKNKDEWSIYKREEEMPLPIFI